VRRLTVLLLTVILLAACSGPDEAGDRLAGTSSADRDAPTDDLDAADDAPASEAVESAPQADDVDGQADAAGEAGDAEVRPAAALAGRQVIRTARVELTAEDPDATVDEVMRVAERTGGFVATTDLRRDDEDVLRGTVTLRVPSSDLVTVLGDLEELAVSAPVSRIDERDVTTETADLEARLTNLTTYEEELRALLADVREATSSPDDLLRIFERIREVRQEIDTIEARLASLADQVSLATVEVRIDPAPTALPVADPTWQPLETVREALTVAARGLSRVADTAIWLALGVLPVALVVAAPLLAIALVWRRMRRRPTSTPPAPDPAA
jgi:hypothetical protein